MELLYEALIGADTPAWKQDNEAVYEINEGLHTGKTICVKVARTGNDLDGDGFEDEIHAQVTGRMVDKVTGETVMIGGRPVQTAPHHETLVLSQADDAQVDAGTWLAVCYEDAIPRVLRREQTLRTVSLIPV